MDSAVREILVSGGIDVDGMLDRCMGSEALLARLLKKFLADSSYARLEEAMQNGDEAAAMEASHTLKGVSGNLSITELFSSVTIQVQALRNHNMKEASAMMPNIKLKYDNAVQAIQKAFN